MLIVSVLYPLITGALLPLFRFRKDRSRNAYVLIHTLITSMLVFALLFQKYSQTETLFEITTYLPVALRLDGAGMVFTGLVAFLWPLASLYGLEYMKGRERVNTFFAFYLMTFGVTLGISMAENLVTLYVFYEMLTLTTLPLVMHGGEKKSIKAGLQYLYYSIGGAALAFIGLLYVIYYGGTTQFTYGGLPYLIGQTYQTPARIGYLFCFFGFAVKAAVFPLHDWLPNASVAPTPVTALLHAVAVVKSGVFAIIRITWYVFGTANLLGTYAQKIPLALAIFTIVFGSTMALKEKHFKRRLAYSTVANLSYILFGALMMTPDGLQGAYMHMLFHGIIKIALFMAAGMYLHHNLAYVSQLRGQARSAPKMSLVFAVFSLALVGIPPFVGFLSKWQLAQSAVMSGSLLYGLGALALIISATLTACYLIIPTVSLYAGREDTPLIEHLEPRPMALAPMLLLLAVMVALSFCASPIIRFTQLVAHGSL